VYIRRGTEDEEVFSSVVLHINAIGATTVLPLSWVLTFQVHPTEILRSVVQKKLGGMF